MHCPSLSELPPPPPDKTGWPWTEESPQPPDTMSDGHPWSRVSIVTPSYNQGQFIEETIRSVLLQGYPDLEYIIMDGGSTDDSVDIIRKYEPWLTYWVSEPDEGQSDAIAKGFGMATGEILAWLNSDDYYYPRAVEVAAHAFHNSPRLQLIYGHCDIVGRRGSLTRRQIVPDFDLNQLRIEDYIWQPATFFRKSAYEQIGGLDKSLHWTMDWDLWLRMAQVERPKKVDEVLAAARVYAENKSRSGGERRYVELIRLLVRHRIFSRMLLFYGLQYLIHSVKTVSMKSPFLHRTCFELPHPLLVRVSRKLRRAAGSRAWDNRVQSQREDVL